MDVKKYLSQAHLLDKRIDLKLEEAYKLRTQAMKMTYCFQEDKISGNNQKSPMESSIVKMITLEEEVNRDIDKLIEIKADILGTISSVEDPTYKLILESRYIHNKTWEEIAESMGCNLRWVYRLHGKAINEVSQFLS